MGFGHGQTGWIRGGQGACRMPVGGLEQTLGKGCFLTVVPARAHIRVRAGRPRPADRPEERGHRARIRPSRPLPLPCEAVIGEFHPPRSRRAPAACRALAAGPGRASRAGWWAGPGKFLPPALALPLPKPLTCPVPAYPAFPLVTPGFRARTGSSQPYDLSWLPVVGEITGSGGSVPSTAGGRCQAADGPLTAGGRA
jgi:hypothetical protein